MKKMLFAAMQTCGVAGLSLALASGCASMPETVVAPTGEPLSAEGQAYNYTYTKSEKVGYVKGKDARGRSTRSDVYADKKKTGTGYAWSSYQGGTKISDDDLFHIAKDPAIEEHRASGVFKSQLGLAVIAVGVAALGGGAALYATRGENDDKKVAYGLVLGGGVVSTIGFLLRQMGHGQVTEQHPFPEERVRETADRYNATLSAGSGREP